jgi:serine/threonine-protein kinase HipA
MYKLTLQIFRAQGWRDAMSLSFDDVSKGLNAPCDFAYKTDYVVDAYSDAFAQSVSAHIPVDFEAHFSSQSPAFLYDPVH